MIAMQPVPVQRPTRDAGRTDARDADGRLALEAGAARARVRGRIVVNRRPPRAWQLVARQAPKLRAGGSKSGPAAMTHPRPVGYSLSPSRLSPTEIRAAVDHLDEHGVSLSLSLSVSLCLSLSLSSMVGGAA